MRRTKVICTLGASTENRCEELIINGMDAARVNFSHETHDIHAARINELKLSRRKLDKPITLLMDSMGPEIRTGVMKDGSILKNGQEFTLVNKSITGDDSNVSITYKDLFRKITAKQDIFIDDGKIHLTVKRIEDENIVCEVVSGGKLSGRKGINVPGCRMDLQFISSKDIDDILFAIENDFDHIALSFVRHPDDVNTVREILKSHNAFNIRIIAKIENKQAVDNIDSIIDCSDGIMVARGDLGVEMNLNEVPAIQKKLIRKCYSKGKPVITATQMLESMVDNIVPTRAEVSDVANAIYDGTSAVMLSGETACGKNPIEALKRMVDIITITETDIDYKERFYREERFTEKGFVSVIGQSATVASFELKAKAIIAITNSGNTARMISRFRPDCPIIAVTVDPIIERQLNLSWGIHPVRTKYIEEITRLFNNTIECAKSTGIVKDNDVVILVAGMPTGKLGKTNMVKIHKIGDVFL